MWVHNEDLPKPVPGALHFNASDTPASRKIAGQAGHSHKRWPCPICEINLAQVNEMSSYAEQQPGEFGRLDDPNELLIYTQSLRVS